MLSPGKWNDLVPKSPRENLAWRLRLYKAAAGDVNLQRGLIEMCAQDILFYINAFAWQYNPDNVGQEVGPFICWDFQEPAIRRILSVLFEQRRDLLIEKSREMGVTWLALIVDDWAALFHTFKKFLAISHSENAVDRAGDPDSLFWKVEFMHDYLPDWMVRGVNKRKLAFNYPATKSSFNGSSTSERSGVGGRATNLLLDEFSKHREDYAIWGQTADTGPRLVIGTHYGIGSCFFSLTQRQDIDRIVIHWSQHPKKKAGLYRSGVGPLGYEILDTTYKFPHDFKFNVTGEPLGGPFPGIRSPWYDNEVRRRNNKRDVAMHLDIDPLGASSQVFDTMQIHTLIQEYCRPFDWEGDVEFNRKTEPKQRLVARLGGNLKLWVQPNATGGVAAGVYGIGGDVAEGVGASPSCFSIGNLKTGEKIGEYTNAFIDPKDLAPVMAALAEIFSDPSGSPAIVAWEVPGPGSRFGRALADLGFRHVFYRTHTDKITRVTTESMGWSNSPDSIRELLGDYRSALYWRQFINPSKGAMEETLMFEYDDRGTPKHGKFETGDPSGAGVNHGDHVIGDALLWMLCKPVAREEKKVKEAAPINSFLWRRQQRQAREREEFVA